MAFSPIPDILDELRAGRPIILVDDADRENEGDLAIVAEKTTPEIVNFFVREGRGVLCLALTNEKADTLDLPLQTRSNTSRYATAFTVSIDAKADTTTGVSAADRCRTILTAIRDDCKPHELARPGHVFPLRAEDGGVLVRSGQTEGIVDLARLAGLRPSGVICEIMNDDGSMARVPQLEAFARRHKLKMASVADVIAYRRHKEKLVERVVKVKLPTALGTFDLHLYRSKVDPLEHLAFTIGVPDPSERGDRPLDDVLLVRVHSECCTGDIFGSLRCDCGPQLHNALRMIAEEGRGIFLYMRQEGRGIGLANKLKAYALQEQGLDTVEANEKLGFRADHRDYGIGAQILLDLGVRKMRFLTNNPKKYHGLEGYGLEIVGRIPLEVPPTVHNLRYLRTKRDKMGHLYRLLDGEAG